MLSQLIQAACKQGGPPKPPRALPRMLSHSILLAHLCARGSRHITSHIFSAQLCPHAAPCPHFCRNGQYSTNKEVLEELVEQHPLPSIILAHRKLSKLLTGFLDTLLQLGQREAQRQGPGKPFKQRVLIVITMTRNKPAGQDSLQVVKLWSCDQDRFRKSMLLTPLHTSKHHLTLVPPHPLSSTQVQTLAHLAATPVSTPTQSLLTPVLVWPQLSTPTPTCGCTSFYRGAGPHPGLTPTLVHTHTPDSPDSFFASALPAATHTYTPTDVQVRIRGQFMQTNTATGRLAMEEPSLQTIPRPVEYELDATSQDPLALTSPLMPPAAAGGSAGAAATAAAGGPTAACGATAAGGTTAAAAASGGWSGGGAAAVSGGGIIGGGGISGGALQESNIRAAFVAPPGWVLLGADYRQLELRLMAHFSGDTNLLAALGSQESDPFVNLAANWLNLPVHEVCG